MMNAKKMGFITLGVMFSLIIISSMSFNFIGLSSANIPNTTLKTGSEINAPESQSDMGHPDSSGYERMDSDGVQPVGVVTVESITSVGEGNYILSDYGMLATDVINGYINYTHLSFGFIGVIKNASFSTLSKITKESYVSVRINNTVQYDYSYKDNRTLISYRPELADTNNVALYNMTINGTGVNLDDVTVLSGGFIYNYSSYKAAHENGTLIVSYISDFNMTISEWEVIQTLPDSRTSGNYSLTNGINSLKANYNYTIRPGAYEINTSTGVNKYYYAYDYTATIKLVLPDKDYLSDFSMGVSDDDSGFGLFTSYTKNADNSIVLTVNSRKNHAIKTYYLNFSAVFEIKFNNVYTGLWARDYLYSGTSVRERQYELTVVGGPDSLFVGYFTFNETTVQYRYILSLRSAFNRANIYYENYTKYSGMEGAILLYREGINTYYYLIKGEIDVITMRYTTNQVLNLHVLDSTKTPLPNVQLRIYYENVTYGTMMSRELTNAIALKTTDYKGQVIVSDVPYGNYTIAIYQYGKFIENITINSDNTVHTINSSIPHFPEWIIVFSSINAVFVLVGVYIYKKQK